MKRLYSLAFGLVGAALLAAPAAHAQSKLYPHLFDLQDVVITDGPFLHAQELNCDVLLKYDLGRLMQPNEKQAGLTESGRAFSNWGGDRGLDGHVGGHYMSALAISYASCQDEAVKAKLKTRLDQYVDRLKECQEAWDKNDNGKMHGYCGGVPHSYDVWAGLAEGNLDEYWASWVPFYNVHKTFAGLRDAWLYAGNETAREVFLKLCDWGVELVSDLSDSQMQNILGMEHGGINEMFADAYQMTGNQKYLDASKRYAHAWLLNGMSSKNGNTINNVHANTQVPKVIGFARTYQQDNTQKYGEAARFFWSNVANERTVAIGGNSIGEWFPDNDHYGNFITSHEGVESCNTYNMLKLSEILFQADAPDSKYADFYEAGMYNHILSTQHPETGGYVYFTSARPQHYRVYSQVNKAMWCCVGSGMENHGKYAEFAYARTDDALYVNLFLPTELNWREKGVKISQATSFPYEQKTTITIEKGGDFAMNVRKPAWCPQMSIKVNGQPVVADAQLGYVTVGRAWKDGDVVEVDLPMSVSIVPLQHYEDYVAIKYGPILLGAKTGTDNLSGLFADESRMGHVASGEQKNLYSAPLLIGSREDLAASVKPVDLSKLQFKIDGYYSDDKWADLVLEPFSGIHESRYMMYWLNVDGKKWDEIQEELNAIEAEAQMIEMRTLDYVDTGTQQSESDHFLQSSQSNFGSHQGEYWRDGQEFSYLLQTRGYTEGVSVMCRYWGGDSGNRTFNIYVDDKPIATESLNNSRGNFFFNVEYPVKSGLLKNKTEIRVKFKARTGNNAGGVFYLRLLRSAEDAAVPGIEADEEQQAGAAYDLSGRRLSDGSRAPGIYIVDGKKYLELRR